MCKGVKQVSVKFFWKGFFIVIPVRYMYIWKYIRIFARFWCFPRSACKRRLETSKKLFKGFWLFFFLWTFVQSKHDCVGFSYNNRDRQAAFGQPGVLQRTKSINLKFFLPLHKHEFACFKKNLFVVSTNEPSHLKEAGCLLDSSSNWKQQHAPSFVLRGEKMGRFFFNCITNIFYTSINWYILYEY